MAVQHDDIRVLRKKGIIGAVWTATDIAPYVNDEYRNQTLANHSPCPCYQSKGYHCQINTKSHRFLRLGDGKYCLPEESPGICPIHNAKSMLSANYYVLKFGSGGPHVAATSSEPPTYSSNVCHTATDKSPLGPIVSNIRSAIDNNTLDDNSVSQFIKDLSVLRFHYNLKTFPPLSKTEFFKPSLNDSPRNLSEALLWKLGKWTSYNNFVKYFEKDDKVPVKTDIIFYAFAKHLKDNNNPIFDQHTLRSMWAVDSALTNDERIFCKNFLMNKNGKWKPSGGGGSGLQCYNLYLRFIRKIQKFNVTLKKLDMLLMPLGQALKKNIKNYEEFCDLCRWTQ